MAVRKKILTEDDFIKYNCFFFYGQDSYSIDMQVNKIITYFLDPSLKDFNFEHYSEENYNLERISSALHSLPMLSDKRIVLISDIDKTNSDIQKLVLLFLKKNIDSSLLILTAKKPDRRKVFFKDIQKFKNFFTQEFKEKNEREILSWMKDYLKQKKKRISDIALRNISLSVSTNLNSVARELDKLLLYSNDNEITPETVENVLGISKDFNIFKLQEAISNRKLAQTLKITYNLLSQKENRTDPIGINLMISRLFVTALEIKYCMHNEDISITNAAYKLGYTNPWRDKDNLACASNYSLEELKNSIKFFLECDIRLKSSFGNKETAITGLMQKIIKGLDPNKTGYLKAIDKLVN